MTSPVGGAFVLGLFMCIGLVLVQPTLATAGEKPVSGPGIEMRTSVGPSIGVNGVGVLGDLSGEFVYHSSVWGNGVGIGGAVGGQFRGEVVGGQVGILLSLDRRLRRAPSIVLSPNMILGYGAWTLERQVFSYLAVEVGLPVRMRLGKSWTLIARTAHIAFQIDSVGASIFLNPSIGFGYTF